MTGPEEWARTQDVALGFFNLVKALRFGQRRPFPEQDVCGYADAARDRALRRFL